MRLLFIRHGDPDYVHDTLTEKGHREAALLAERAEALQLGKCFVSPLGRAQATAGYSMKKLGRTAKTLGWLQEFPARIDLNRAPQLLDAFPNARTGNMRRISYGILCLRTGENSVIVWIRRAGGSVRSAAIRTQ